MSDPVNSLNTNDAATYLGIKAQTLRKAVAVGKLGAMPPPKHYKAGRKLLFLKSDLDEWINSSKALTS